MSDTAVVTGGTGFIGANVIRYLLGHGNEVHVIARPGHRRWRLMGIESELRVEDVSLEDAERLKDVMARIRPRWIFHLAAHGAYSYETDLRRIAQTNVIGTVNLLDACLRVGFDTLVNTGSSSEYGFKDHPPHEQEWLEPNSSYAVSKASATLFCRHLAKAHNVRIPTVRIYSAFGTWEEPTRLMPALVVAGIQGAYPPLVSPDTARDFVYIDDVVDAMVSVSRAMLTDPGAIFNVGTGMQTTMRELVGLVQEQFGIDKSPDWGSYPARPWDTTVWHADVSQIRQELGWHPQVSLSDGLRRFTSWIMSDERILEIYRQKLGGEARS